MLKTVEIFRRAFSRRAAASPNPATHSFDEPEGGGPVASSWPSSSEEPTAVAKAPRPALDRVRELLRLGNDALAFEVAQAGLERDPDDVDLQRETGEVQRRLGLRAEARETLESVLQKTGEDGDVLLSLAEVCGEMGDADAALSHWQRLVELTEGADDRALTGFGIALSNAGQHAEAVAFLERVTGRRGDGPAFADLGMALLAAGQIHEAVEAFSQARVFDPTSAQAHCGLGLAYQRLERWKEAAEAFAETEKLSPESAVGPFNLGLALAQIGDWKGTRHALLRAAAIEPDDPEIREALERLFMGPLPDATDGGIAGAPFTPSISGSLRTFHLLDLLEFLRIQAKTGALVVASRSGVGKIELVRGAVATASAPGVKRLGETFIERGLISRPTLDNLLARKHAAQQDIRRDENRQEKRHEKRQEKREEGAEFIGEALVTAGHANADQVGQVVLEQILSSVEELYRWQEGTFSFHPGEEREASAISFDLRQVVLEVMRRFDEGLRDEGLRDEGLRDEGLRR